MKQILNRDYEIPCKIYIRYAECAWNQFAKQLARPCILNIYFVYRVCRWVLHVLTIKCHNCCLHNNATERNYIYCICTILLSRGRPKDTETVEFMDLRGVAKEALLINTCCGRGNVTGIQNSRPRLRPRRDQDQEQDPAAGPQKNK